MKILDLQNEFRELIAQLRHEIETASAMGQFDAHEVSENLMCGLLRELCGWSDLRNLNREQVNFPGIDLADDTHRVASTNGRWCGKEKKRPSAMSFQGNSTRRTLPRYFYNNISLLPQTFCVWMITGS